MERAQPSAIDAVVAHAEPAMPRPSRKIRTSFRIAFATATAIITASETLGLPMPLKNPREAPQHHGEWSAQHARHPPVRRERDDVLRKPEEREDPLPLRGERHEEWHCRESGPQAEPYAAGGARALAGAVGLRHEGLHGEADAAEAEQEDDREEMHGTHRRHRLDREPADEPRVGEVQHELHCAVQHQRQGERQDGPQVHPPMPVGVVPHGRKARGNR